MYGFIGSDIEYPRGMVLEKGKGRNKRRDSIEKILNTEASAIKGTQRYLDIGLHSSFMEKILPGTKRRRCTSIFHSAINPTSRSNKLNGQINREQNFPPNKPPLKTKLKNLEGINPFVSNHKFSRKSRVENFPSFFVPSITFA